MRGVHIGARALLDICNDMVWYWLYRSPIVVGEEGGILLFQIFKNFYLPSRLLGEGEGGQNLRVAWCLGPGSKGNIFGLESHSIQLFYDLSTVHIKQSILCVCTVLTLR